MAKSFKEPFDASLFSHLTEKESPIDLPEEEEEPPRRIRLMELVLGTEALSQMPSCFHFLVKKEKNKQESEFIFSWILIN